MHCWIFGRGLRARKLAPDLRTAGCQRREWPLPFSPSRSRQVFLRYSGERSFGVATFATISLNRSCTHGVSRVSASAALILRTIGSGVPFGKNRPNQVLTSKSGKPLLGRARQVRNLRRALRLQNGDPLDRLPRSAAFRSDSACRCSHSGRRSGPASPDRRRDTAHGSRLRCRALH